MVCHEERTSHSFLTLISPSDSPFPSNKCLRFTDIIILFSKVGEATFCHHQLLPMTSNSESVIPTGRCLLHVLWDAGDVVPLD